MTLGYSDKSFEYRRPIAAIISRCDASNLHQIAALGRTKRVTKLIWTEIEQPPVDVLGDVGVHPQVKAFYSIVLA